MLSIKEGMKNMFLMIFSSNNNHRAKQEIADLEAAFRRVDVNGDGKVKHNVHIVTKPQMSSFICY